MGIIKLSFFSNSSLLTSMNRTNLEESFGFNISYDGINYDELSYVGICYDGISYVEIISY